MRKDLLLGSATAVNADAARAALDELSAKRCAKYGAIMQLWDNAEEFIPFLDYDGRDPPGDLFHELDRVPSTPATGGSCR